MRKAKRRSDSRSAARLRYSSRSSLQPSPEHGEGVRGLLWDDAIAAEAQAVQPIGKPISASTNCGFKTGEGGEVVAPSVGVAWRGREGSAPEPAIASNDGRTGPTLPAAPPWFEPYVVAEGVGNIRIASVNVVPGCITPVFVVCLAASLLSQVFGVG